MKEHVTCRIESDTLEKAIKIAQDENRSLSNLIENALIALVNEKSRIAKKKSHAK